MHPLHQGDPGEIGPYRILGRLGGGGMGQVYLGRTRGGRLVAVKVIRPELATDPEFRARFEREVAAARKVDAFYTAHVVDADPHASSPWMATAYIEGMSLRETVQAFGPYPVEAVTALGAALAEGLKAIHEAGLVHRDLKPANIIMAGDGPRIIDFGVARPADGAPITSSNRVVGTPAYMSPEQFTGKATAESDVFALGCVLAFAATGRSPFDAPEPPQIMFKVMQAAPELDGIPPGQLQDSMLECLAKEPAGRPRPADLLERFSWADPGLLRRPAPVAGGELPGPTSREPVTVPMTNQGEPVGKAGSGRIGRLPRRTAIIAAATALTLVLAGIVSYALTQGSSGHSGRSGNPTLAGRASPSSQLIAEANQLLAASQQASSDLQPDTAMKFLAEAGRLDPASPQVRNALLATQAVPFAGRLLVSGAPDSHHMVSVAFSPKGTLIAGGDDGSTVYLWDAATYRLLWSYKFLLRTGVSTNVNAVAFSPDGKTLAVSWLGEAWLWDVTDPAHPVPSSNLPLATSDFQTTALAFTRDGTTLAAATWDQATTTGAIQLWNMASTPQSLEGTIEMKVTVRRLAFTPDGRTLISRNLDGAIDEWNVKARTRAAVIERAVPSPVGGALEDAMALRPDGAFLAFTVDASTLTSPSVIQLWDLATRQVVVTIQDPGGVTSLAFSPDGRQLAASDSLGVVRLWEVRKPAPLLGTLAGHRTAVQAIAFSPDGTRLASASSDGTIGLWNAQGTTLGGLANSSLSATFSPDGQTLAVSAASPDAGVYAALLYRMPARTLIAVLPTGSSFPTLAFNRSGTMLAVAFGVPGGGEVEFYDVATHKLAGSPIRTSIGNPAVKFLGIPNRIGTVAFSPDGKLLAICSWEQPTLEVWSTARRTRVAVVADNQYASTPPATDGAKWLAFSPDGKLLATAGLDGDVRVYDVPRFARLVHINQANGAASVAFSPDGRELADGTLSGDIYRYSVPASYAELPTNLPQLPTLSSGNKLVTSVQFSSDGTLIAGGFDDDVRFWAVPRAGGSGSVSSPVLTLATHGAGQIGQVAYSGPLGLLVTADTSVTRVWQTDPGKVAAGICATLKAPVQPSLWRQYLPTIAYMPVCG